MNTKQERLETIKALRDIFLSNNSKELLKAFLNLTKETKIPEMELETQFNRYFIGPDTPIAAPYASLYLNKEDSLMTKTTIQIRNLYEIMGFKNSLKNKVPEDFLGLELDAYYQLLFIELEKNNSYLKNLRIYFLHEHINIWIFKFISKVMKNLTEQSNTIKQIIKELETFFQNELKIKGEIS